MKKNYTTLFALFFILNISAQNTDIQFIESGEKGFFTNLFTPKSTVQPPLQQLAPTFSKFQISAQSAQTLRIPSGTNINIPNNAFLDKYGNLVTGKVKVFYREFNNPLDIYLSGIPMTTMENGEEIPFQSAGMFELTAFQNEEAVFPNPDAPITVELNSSQTLNDFDTYALEEETGNWEKNGKDEILPPTQEIMDNFQQFNLWRFLPTKPKLDTLHYWINYKGTRTFSNGMKKAQFQISATGKKFNKGFKDSIYLTKKFQDIALTNKITWLFEGENRRKFSKEIKVRKNINLMKAKLKALNLPTDDVKIRDYYFRNIIIEPNFEADNYWIHCISRVDTFSIPAYPYFRTSNTEIDKKRNLVFYNKYQNALKKRLFEWEKYDEIHQIKMKEYAESLTSVKAQTFLKQIEEANNMALSRRRVTVSTFGVCNIDRLMKQIDETAEILVMTETGKSFKPKNVVVLDEFNNAMLCFNHKIRFVKSSPNSLILYNDKNEIAMISSKEFKAYFEGKKNGKIRMEAEFFPKDELSKEELESALAANF